MEMLAVRWPDYDWALQCQDTAPALGAGTSQAQPDAGTQHSAKPPARESNL